MSPAPSPTIINGDLATRMHQQLSAAADSGFNGAVLVVQGGRPILHTAYGFADRERSIRVTTATPFWIVSVSKQFAAGAVLKLAEEGRLSIGDSIARFFLDAPPDKRAVTIHQLLTHTAGLAGQDAADRLVDRDVAVQAILTGPLARMPGSEYGYTNDAYNLLAAIVEIASESPYETYVRRVLLEPAGLGQTGFWGPMESPEVASILPASWGDPALLRPNWGYRGARGMYSTAADLYAWYVALNAHRLLSAASVDLLFTPHVMARSTGVGYGWFVSRTPHGTKSVWTRGNQGSGHGAVLAVFPQDHVVMAIVSNTDRFAPAAPMGHRLAASLSELIFGLR